MPEQLVRRVLYADDPRKKDYLAARDEVHAIRMELSRLRHRLRELARTEALFWFDASANDAAGALSLVIVSLHRLEEGDRSFTSRAERAGALWADVEARPDAYLIEPGTSRDADRLRNARATLARSDTERS